MFVIIATIVAICLLTYYVRRGRNYWADKGVPQESKFSLGAVGNMILRLKPECEVVRELYAKHRKHRYYGFYELGNNVLTIRDPQLIKQMGIKDFDYFTDHFVIRTVDPLWTNNLFNLGGEKWREMRAVLSPSFTSSKMKMMFHLMKKCAASFTAHFRDNRRLRDAVDMKDALSRYSNDIIASLAFGVECDSLKNGNNEFYMMGKEATNFSTPTKSLAFSIAMISWKLAKLFDIRVFSKECADFFTNLVDETLKIRKEKNVKRQDILQMLIESNKERHQENASEIVDTGFATVEEHIKPIITDHRLTNEDITAQLLIFYLGGTDSISHVMQFLTYELAVNPDVQETLIEEVDDTDEQCNGDVSYEALMRMKYLDMVISETLRKYPTFIRLDRACGKPYEIQPEHPNESLVRVEEGDIITFPLYAIHYDEEYYQDPEKFDPERFNDDNKRHIKPYTYFPFGVGPRNCIGSRFALLECKVLTFLMLKEFQFVVVQKTPIPLKFAKGTFVIKPEQPIILGVKPRGKGLSQA